MGIKGLTLLVFAVLSGSQSYAATFKLDNESIMEARQILKDYGLVNCLREIDPESQLAEDLGGAQRSFFFMGQGKHRLIQEQDTLEIQHNPYQDTLHYMQDQTQKHIGHMKNGTSSKSIGCLKVYHSKAFDDFIIQQDPYIREK